MLLWNRFRAELQLPCVYFSESTHWIPPRPNFFKAVLAALKGRLPKNPRCADSGEGWGEIILQWRSSMWTDFFSAGLPQRMKTIDSRMIVERLDDAVGECFPASLPVRIGFGRSHRQHSVQKQHALLSPSGEVARTLERRNQDRWPVP